MCAEQATFSPLLVLSPASSWRRCLMPWAGGCHQAALLPHSVRWHKPCSHVTAPEGATATGAACLESRRGSPCLLARGMSLGSAATCIFSTDSNRSFHWKHLVCEVIQSSLAMSFVWPSGKHATLHLSVS